MDEPASERCGLVYFTAGHGDMSELFTQTRRPTAAAVPSDEGQSRLAQVHRDVQMLLDVDQGGFDQVFLTSRTVDCLDRLRGDAKSIPVAVLIALPTATSSSEPATSLDLLRAVSVEAQGSKHPQHVMPFALLSDSSCRPHDKPPLDAALHSDHVDAGAIDVLRSPLGTGDCTRLVGHVKELIRPPAHLIGASMPQSLVNCIQRTVVPPPVAHRPDLTVPPERRQRVEEAVGQWHFPALDFDMDELTYGALYMLERTLSSPELEPYRIPRAQLMGFLLATRRQYKHEREVYYHNWRHAVDVTQSIYCFLLDARLSPVAASDDRPMKDLNPMERLLTPLDGLLLLTSAVGHDVGHPGVNNAFLTACNHPIAQMYNDKSVLENFHCATYSQMLRLHWPSLSNVPGFRSSMIANILATDMQRHFDYMTNLGDMKRQIESSGEDTSEWSESQRKHARELMMALLMKAADISNIARPFDVSSRWAKILMCEFSRQGELEEELGIPTCLYGGPPNKEDLLAAAQSQKAFMGLFGVPLFVGMAEIMPSVYCAVQELQTNQVVWDEKIDHETQRQQLQGASLPLTFSTVTSTEVEEAKVRHHKSEPSAVPAEAFQPPSTPVKRQPVVDAETVSSVHPAGRLRKHAAGGVGSDDKRSSAPFLPPGSPLSHSGSASSRRSSKDVALGQLHLPGTFAHQSLSPGSRRGSADASWHFQQSYPGSRRGSKDESLTTILVTSAGQGSPSQRGSPVLASSDDTVSPGSASKQSIKRTSMKQQSTTIRTSIPSARSHATSSAATAASQHSPSTQPSSLAIVDDPFTSSSLWSNDLDGAQSTLSRQQTDPASPSPSADNVYKGYPLPAIPRSARENAEDAIGEPPKKADRSLRESRSRSRLRGLKFWKKKRDASGMDDHESASP